MPGLAGMALSCWLDQQTVAAQAARQTCCAVPLKALQPIWHRVQAMPEGATPWLMLEMLGLR
jgi:hypothetical protein